MKQSPNQISGSEILPQSAPTWFMRLGERWEKSVGDLDRVFDLPPPFCALPPTDDRCLALPTGGRLKKEAQTRRDEGRRRRRGARSPKPIIGFIARCQKNQRKKGKREKEGKIDRFS